MERRADSAVCERAVGEVEVDVAAESEDSKKGFDGLYEDGLSGSGYNEVFEEALEPPSPLLQHEVPDSRYAASNGAEVGAVAKQEECPCPTDLMVSDTNDGVAVEEQMVGSEKFADRTDAVVHHQRLDEQENVDTERSDNSINAAQPDQSPDEEMIGLEKLNGAVDAEIDGRRYEVEEAVSDIYVDAQHVDQNSEEEILVESQKRIAASGKSDSALGEKEDEDNSMHNKPYSVVLDNEYGDGMSEDANGSPVVANDGELPVSRMVDSSIDEQNDDVIFEEHNAFESEEVISANDEPDHAYGQVEGEFDFKHNKPSSLVSQCVHGDEISEAELRTSVVVEDGELIVVNVKEPFAKRPQNEELEGVQLDELSNLLHAGPTNTNEVSSDIGSSRQIPDLALIQQVEDISIQSVAILKQQEKFHQPEENATTDNSYATIGHSPVGKNDSGIATNGHASVEKDGSSSSCAAITANVSLKEDKADTRDSTKEFQKESVESHLSSTSSDKKNSTQLASVSLNPEHSRGPNLSSRPAGLGSSAPLLENLSRPSQQPRANGSTSQRVSLPSNDPPIDDGEENDETREKLQMIRVKFLRLAHRLGQTPHNVVVAQVLYRLGLAEQLKRNTNRTGVFSFDRAKVVAEQLEAAGQETLDFSCTIMVIGKTGVGKSATINSIFDEVKLPIDAFRLGTKKVQEVVGMVQGIKVRVIDTPGLFSSSSDQHRNEKILHSMKRFITKSPPDIVLYFDRLDMQSRDYGDAPLLRTITDIFGASIWFNAIVVLTHAASAPPDGPNGSPLSYEMFVTQRTHVVQQAIRQAAGDVRLMNPVSLVENHSACRMNRAGQRVLPNGQVWKPQLLLLSFASKILGEANMLLNLQDSPPGRPFGSRPRVPPLPFLLSSLLQSKPQPKLPEDQFGDDDNLDEDLDETSDSDEGSDIDELPPFKPLTKSQIAKLSKAQKKAYFEELDYRERLFYKKQLKEGKRRRKFAKKMAHMAKDAPSEHNNGDVEEESGAPASVPVPLPDFVLPNSFDSDNPTHRYRFLDSSSQWLIRPVLDSQGWDHDIGYEGLNVERTFVVKDKIPLSVSGQLTKDKKECTFQMELASAIKHSESKATSLCLDMQTVGKDIAYTLRGETRFRNFRRNNTIAGVSATVLGDSTSAGLKLEDKLIVSKRLRLLVSGGAMTGRGDVAYGGRLEATLRDKDYPIGQALSTLALSIVDWHGDLSLGCNIQSHMPLGRGTNLIGHANLSNKGTGQIGIRLNSSEHLQIVLLALVPILRNAQRMLFSSQST